MDREIFLNKSVIEQIEYFNSKLETGMSISKISKKIGISKSITEKFKKNGYTLKDNQLVYINTSEKTSSPNKTTSDIYIEAHTEKEARQIATRMYDDEEVVLDLDFCDHIQTNMTVKRSKPIKTKDEMEDIPLV